jgi:hypothetical protein
MSIVLMGSTSGSCTLQEQAVAGTTTLTLPTFNGTVGLLVSGTAVASTSGTSIDFTGIPAGVRRITVMMNGVSTNGSSNIQIQIGDSGGIETTSYVSGAGFAGGSNSASSTTSTTGFVLTAGLVASNTLTGIVVICNHTSNTWTESFSGAYNSGSGAFGGGYKDLSATLDRIRITTVNGTDTFDAGSINILYE